MKSLKSMKPRNVLLIFFAGVAVVAAALYLLQAPGYLTEAAAPGTAQGEPNVSACSGLTGQELDRCKLHVWYQSQQQVYEKGPDGDAIDASSNSARAARGSGVEGVTSSGVTTQPPR